MSSSVLILVVEDERAIQLIVEEALTDGGYAVQLASSAAEAMVLLDEARADYKAVVTDVNLVPSDLTGWDVARHAREITPDLPIIYMTGASAHEWGSHGVPNSVLMTKPFVPAQVVTAVSQLLNERSSSPLG